MSAKICYENAKRLSQHQTNDNVCTRCVSGKIHMTMVDLFDQKKNKTTEIDCIDCNGKGTLNPQQSYQQQLNKNVWCKCGNKGSVYATDGRSIFGNDTYLCTTCGMVSQFG